MVLPEESMQVAVSIGSKIRALRQRLRLTLDEAAAAAGISKPFLSQVERGHATPSFTSLAGIAKALGVTMQYFVETPTEAKSICRSDALQYFSFVKSADSFARLSNLMEGRKLDAILVRLPVGGVASEIVSQAGEEFVYLIAGKIALTLEDQTFMLNAGDTAHYEATGRHAWRNSGTLEAVLIWIGTPRLL